MMCFPRGIVDRNGGLSTTTRRSSWCSTSTFPGTTGSSRRSRWKKLYLPCTKGSSSRTGRPSSSTNSPASSNALTSTRSVSRCRSQAPIVGHGAGRRRSRSGVRNRAASRPWRGGSGERGGTERSYERDPHHPTDPPPPHPPAEFGSGNRVRHVHMPTWVVGAELGGGSSTGEGVAVIGDVRDGARLRDATTPWSSLARTAERDTGPSRPARSRAPFPCSASTAQRRDPDARPHGRLPRDRAPRRSRRSREVARPHTRPSPRRELEPHGRRRREPPLRRGRLGPPDRDGVDHGARREPLSGERALEQ